MIERGSSGTTPGLWFEPALPRPEAVAVLAREALARLAGRSRDAVWLPPSEAEIDRLCRALISADPDAADHLVQRFRDGGMPAEGISLGQLATAVRRLGTWWEEDLVSSALVTLGCSRVHRILHALDEPTSDLAASIPDHGGAALFASVPGEQHTLGVTMAAQAFRRRGWAIGLLVGHTHEELVDRFIGQRPGIIGLSASGTRALPGLARLVDAIQEACPRARIMICGQLVTNAPEVAERLRADAAAGDMDAALAAMETLRVGLRSQGSRRFT